MTCTAASTGGAPTAFEWYKGTTKLTSTGTKGEMYEVTNVALTDAGDYKCKAINGAGNAESTAQTLVVIGKNIFTFYSVHNKMRLRTVSLLFTLCEEYERKDSS